MRLAAAGWHDELHVRRGQSSDGREIAFARLERPAILGVVYRGGSMWDVMLLMAMMSMLGWVWRSLGRSAGDINNNGIRALAAAMETVWGKKPLYRREGGSIGVVAMLQNVCGVESGLVGGGLPDDNVHSPNERMHLPTWYRNMDAFIHFFFTTG